MSLLRTSVIVLAGAMAAQAAFAAGGDAPRQPSCPRAAAMEFLTPNERLMLLAETRQSTADMSREQRRAYRQSERQKLQAMSGPDKQKFAAALDAKWNALPADRKAKIEAAADKFRRGGRCSVN